jgi:multidrug resistance efflux pump
MSEYVNNREDFDPSSDEGLEAAYLSGPTSPSRRRAVLTLAALPSFPTNAETTEIQSRGHGAFNVESPKDGVIASIYFSDGRVKAGDIICEIEADDEQRAVDRINLAMQLLELEEHLLDPAQVKIRRSILEASEISAAKGQQLAKQIYDYYYSGSQLGVSTTPEVASANINLTRAQAEHAKAVASLKLFDFNVSQAQKRLALYKQQIPTEQSFIKNKINRLKISAPIDGSLTLYFGLRSFIEKGHLLATITTA